MTFFSNEKVPYVVYYGLICHPTFKDFSFGSEVYTYLSKGTCISPKKTKAFLHLKFPPWKPPTLHLACRYAVAHCYCLWNMTDFKGLSKVIGWGASCHAADTKLNCREKQASMWIILTWLLTFSCNRHEGFWGPLNFISNYLHCISSLYQMFLFHCCKFLNAWFM